MTIEKKQSYISGKEEEMMSMFLALIALAAGVVGMGLGMMYVMTA